MVRPDRGPTQAHADPAWPRNRPLGLRGVALRRGDATILRDVSVTFEPGRRYVVLGPSGSGKSTLLRLLNRLEDPSAGEVRIGETPLATLPVPLIRRSVGLVFQAARPLPGTLRENLAYPAAVARRPPPDTAALHVALAGVGLDPADLDRDAAGLSGGERQRLALAVALQTNPEILALDEVTAALDPEAARRVAALLDGLAQARGLRTIAVTHQAEFAPWLGETAVVVAEGRVVDVGPIGPILERRRV